MRALLARMQARLATSETVAPVLLAVGVGLSAGAAVIGFGALIELAHRTFFEGGVGPSFVPARLQALVLPAVGMLLASALARRFAPEAEGTGIPQVMLAIRKRGGRIRKRVTATKALASALTIGTGGSVGREGPVVQIGASVASTLGQALGLRERRMQVLVACGAAAAIGANFHAPIAGAIFALEVVLGSFAGRDFGLVVIASVAGTALVQAVVGRHPAFELPEAFTLVSAWELPLYLLLGSAAGLLAVGFQRTLYGVGDLFAAWDAPRWLKSVAGGLGVGLCGWAALHFLGEPSVLGVGYEGIERALGVRAAPGAAFALATFAVLAVLLLLKTVATALTLAGGGSGGVFAPSLYLGAMAGGAFGVLVGEAFPAGVAPPGAYALVGMGALFAAAAHAPITAVLILFEMSDNYLIILPLMAAVGASYLVSSRISPESVYAVKLRRLGGTEPAPSEAGILDLVLVADAMVSDVRTVAPDTPLSRLAALLHETGARILPVQDEQGGLVGLVTASDVWNALTGGEEASPVASDVMSRDLVRAIPEESLREVLQRLEEHELGQVLVVDRENPRLLLGVLRREEIFWAFGEMMTEHQRLLRREGMEIPQDAMQVAVAVRPEHQRLAFRPIREIGLPRGALVTVLRRAGRAMVPQGDTVIEPGDVLIVVTTRAAEPKVRGWLRGLARPPVPPSRRLEPRARSR